jgi:transporter family-2 protein
MQSAISVYNLLTGSRRTRMHLIYCLLAVIGGALLPIQAGINGHLRASLVNPWSTTTVSIVVSLVTVVLLSILTRAQIPSASILAQIPWWAWSGGIFGAVYVCIALAMAQRLGAAALMASLVAGQMICSLLLDHLGIAGFSQHSISIGRVGGALLLFAGVLLMQKY